MPANTFDWGGMNFLVANVVQTVATGITSGSVQTQAGATQLTAPINRVDTNATAANGVRLPAIPLGNTSVVVVNNTANALQVYGYGTDTINGAATTTGVSIPAGKCAEFYNTATVSGANALFMNLSA